MKITKHTALKLIVQAITSIKLVYLIVPICLLCSSAANAETYRCIKQGQTSYSELPCQDGRSEVVEIKTAPVSEQAYQRALEQHQKNQAALQKIEAEHQKEAALRAKAAQAQAQKSQKQKSRCDELQLKIQWAREDLRNAKPKTEAKAQQKLKRAVEKAKLACPADHGLIN